MLDVDFVIVDDPVIVDPAGDAEGAAGYCPSLAPISPTVDL